MSDTNDPVEGMISIAGSGQRVDIRGAAIGGEDGEDISPTPPHFKIYGDRLYTGLDHRVRITAAKQLHRNVCTRNQSNRINILIINNIKVVGITQCTWGYCLVTTCLGHV